MLKLWIPDLLLIRWRKKWRKLRNNRKIIIVSQKTFFSWLEISKNSKRSFSMFTEKFHWLPWKKEEKNIIRLGWSRYKFAIATAIQ